MLSPLPTDEAFINSISRGDTGAMRVLYSKCAVHVYRYVLQFIFNRLVAEQIVSDVFHEVWLSAEHFDERTRVATWLLKIARHKVLAAGRDTEPATEHATILEWALADGREISVHRQAANANVRNGWMRLSCSDREMLSGVYYHGSSIGETAQIVGLSPTIVKIRMSCARKRMAQYCLIANNEQGDASTS
jgi:RNA polymerase sigma-70 factor (ECF subfamily)